MRWLFSACRQHRQAVLYNTVLIGQKVFCLFLYAAEVVVVLPNMYLTAVWPRMTGYRRVRW